MIMLISFVFCPIGVTPLSLISHNHTKLGYFSWTLLELGLNGCVFSQHEHFLNWGKGSVWGGVVMLLFSFVLRVRRQGHFVTFICLTVNHHIILHFLSSLSQGFCFLVSPSGFVTSALDINPHQPASSSFCKTSYPPFRSCLKVLTSAEQWAPALSSS